MSQVQWSHQLEKTIPVLEIWPTLRGKVDYTKEPYVFGIKKDGTKFIIKSSEIGYQGAKADAIYHDEAGLIKVDKKADMSEITSLLERIIAPEVNKQFNSESILLTNAKLKRIYQHVIYGSPRQRIEALMAFGNVGPFPQKNKKLDDAFKHRQELLWDRRDVWNLVEPSEVVKVLRDPFYLLRIIRYYRKVYIGPYLKNFLQRWKTFFKKLSDSFKQHIGLQ